jgi:pilus assembly protein Flp/PilA
MFEMIMTYFRSVVKSEQGQALVEYALILGLVSVVAIAALTGLGTAIIGKLNDVTGELTGAGA